MYVHIYIYIYTYVSVGGKHLKFPFTRCTQLFVSACELSFFSFFERGRERGGLRGWTNALGPTNKGGEEKNGKKDEMLKCFEA